MKSQQVVSLRIYFLIGITLAFISLFLEWYVFQGVDCLNSVVVDWSYHIFFDWYSPLHIDTELNNWYKPINSSVPIPLTLFFILLLILSSFGALFYCTEMPSKMKNAKGFAVINLGVLFLLGFYIIIYPIVYLFPNQLLFPLLIFYDYELELTFHFGVGIGYYLQVIASSCCFPYTRFYYQFAHTFTFEIESSNSKLNAIPIDLDKIIAEADFLIHQQQTSDNEILQQQEIYQEFLEAKNRRKRTT